MLVSTMLALVPVGARMLEKHVCVRLLSVPVPFFTFSRLSYSLPLKNSRSNALCKTVKREVEGSSNLECSASTLLLDDI